jgi:hypothetical protein
MHGWTIALAVGAIASGLFAFGVIPSAYALPAQGLFFVFVVVLALVLLGNLFSHEHGGAFLSGSRKIALVGLTGGAAVLTYMWIANDWTAEKVGRGIDRHAAALSQEAQTYFHQISARGEAPAEEEQTAEVE